VPELRELRALLVGHDVTISSTRWPVVLSSCSSRRR
jgi:hypothetical protein